MLVILFVFGRTGFSSRSIVSWLHNLFPAWDVRVLSRAELIARKGFHLAGYLLLGFLLLRGLEAVWLLVSRRCPERGVVDGRVDRLSPASREIIVYVTLFLILCFAYFDELHQRRVPERVFSEKDVIIDVVGALIGMVVTSWKRRPD